MLQLRHPPATSVTEQDPRRRRVIVVEGYYFGLIKDPHLWMRLCAADSPMKDVMGCYRVALYYQWSGIIEKLNPILVDKPAPHRCD